MIGALETILSRPKTVLTLMVVMVVAGIFTYINIPKEADPNIDVPVYLISVNQQGISPGDAERLLARPMETQLRGLDGLKEITTISSQSNTTVILEFNIGSDKDKVLADIRDKVDKAKAELPAEADEPGVYETNLALKPTLIITLSGNVPERTLFGLAKKLQDQVEAISNVREAKLKGTRGELLEVILDLTKLESYDITQQELLTALSQNNQMVPAGFIDDGNARFNLKLPGLVETAEDVFSIAIKQNNEGVVTLGDVAEIRRTFKDPSSYTRVNGRPAMSLEVVKRIGTNIIKTNAEVREVVAEFTKDWPSTVKINFLVDQSNFIFEVLGSLQASILTAIALVMIIVVGSLGVRSGLLVGLAIPTSFMVGFLILSSLGMTVNMMVMFGMVLTVGMLVDGAIVVTEYADRKMAEGMPAAEAYPRAAKLMFWPVVSSTATTLAAFLPLLMWPGVPGEFMSYLPVMVIIVLSASLMTALVFMPTTGVLITVVSDFFAKYARIGQTAILGALAGAAAWYVGLADQPEIIQKAGSLGIAIVAGIIGWWLAGIISTYRKNHPAAVDETALMLSSQSELNLKKMSGFTGGYMRLLHLATANIFGNLVVIILIVGVTITTFSMFGENSKGVEFFVEEEPNVAILAISARGNLSGANIRDIAIEVENEVLKVAGIANTVMTATAPGGERGGGGIDLGAPQDLPADAIAIMQIDLADYSQRRQAEEIFAEIKQRTSAIAGIKIEIRKIQGGPPTGKDVRLQVKSTDYDQMLASVARVREQFNSYKDLQDIEDGRPLPGIEWELTVNREEAGRYNAGIAAVGSMIQLVTNGVLIGKYRPDDSDDEVDIRVRLPEAQRSLDRLDDLRLRTSNGQVPLSNFVTMQPKQKIGSITRKDGLYTMSVKANIEAQAKKGGLTSAAKVTEIKEWLAAQEWPEAVHLEFRGADKEQQESGEFLGKAAIGALFLMFVILLTQFNSFYQTILTLSTVILAVVGVLIGMMITGQKFSIIMTGTGVVALAGIVVNNAIVLIDTYNRLRSEGVDIKQAILKTAGQRLRPIMLTTVTTIMGLVPMALAINVNFIDRIISVGSITAIWWIQLSTAIISGLGFSTVLTLVMIPVMLSLPSNLASAGRWIAGIFVRPQVTQIAVASTNVTQINEGLVEIPLPERVGDLPEVAVADKPKRAPVKRKTATKTAAKKPGKRKVAVKKTGTRPKLAAVAKPAARKRKTTGADTGDIADAAE
ncbi:MAG: efflux RND transporter permease subunit [Rhizobiaceae bacterium]|nr:efflux RND transporter permease subunit [Rhizobiaceae bacterium]